MEGHVPAHGVGGLLSWHCLPACCSVAACFSGIRGLWQSWNFPFYTVNAERLIVQWSIFSSSKPWKPRREPWKPSGNYFFTAKRALHYELIIKKLEPNVYCGLLSDHNVYINPAIFRTDFSRIQHLNENEKSSYRGCIWDTSNKKGGKKAAVGDGCSKLF